MDNKTLHPLIPPEDYKAILGLDDREDPLSPFLPYSGNFYRRTILPAAAVLETAI
jgi:hypothetical protein